MSRPIIALAAALLTTGAAQAQQPAEGFAACSVIFPSKNRLVYTNPLPAAQSATEAMARDFAAHLQRQIYSGEPQIEMLGDCHWEPTEAKADDYMNTIKRNVVARGMTSFGLSYTPAVAH